MKTLMKFLLILFPLYLYSFNLYLMTDKGEIAYSQDKGVSWNWKSTPLPMTPAVDLTSNKNGDLYYVSKNGEVYKSTDGANTWTSVQNLPMSDAIGIWVLGADSVYVLGENGDLYTSVGGWSLKLNLGLSDFVDLFPDVSSGLLAITSSGDVVKIQGSTASIIGNIGASDIVAGIVKHDTIFVITNEGDIAYSANGINYTFIGSVSQTGIRGIVAPVDGFLYATTEGGEVAKSSNGSNWTFNGSANQIYIRGITSDTLVLDNRETPPSPKFTNDKILKIYPNPARGRFSIYLSILKSGKKEIFISDITGREKLLFSGFIPQGTQRLELNTKNLKGVYSIIFGKDKEKIILY